MIQASNNPFPCEPFIGTTISAVSDKLISIGEITKTANTLYIPSGASWIINSVIYNTTAIATIPVPLAAAGLARTDILVANTLSQIVRVAGTETSGIIIQPNTPPNTVFVTSFRVDSTSITAPTPIIVGENFIEKLEKDEELSAGSGAITYNITNKKAGYLINTGVTQINGCTVALSLNYYDGKKYFFKNNTSLNVTLKNNFAVSIPFVFPNAIDFVLKPNETIEFLLRQRIGLKMEYVGVITSGGGSVTDATTLVKGIIKLSGDLGGTADLPTVPGLATKVNLSDINNESLNFPELGMIISDNFDRASLGSSWTNGGTGTFSIVSNKLQVVGGATFDNTRTLIYNTYGNSNLESFTINASIVAGTIDANSHGVGFGLESNSNAIFKSNLKICIRMNTGNLGFIEMNQTGSGGVFNNISNNGLTISSGDVLAISIKFIKNKFIVTVLNQNTNFLNVHELEIPQSNPFTFLTPNAYRNSIIALGGTHLVDDYSVFANDLKNIPILTIGDSIAKGLTSSYIGYRYTELINNLTDTVTQTNAGPGNVIEDINTNEILSLAPKKILVHIGTNNIAFGEPGNLTLTQSKFQTLISALTGYTPGVNLFILTLLPRAGSNANNVLFNSWLFTTYGASAVVDVYSVLNSAGSFNTKYSLDGVHPNDFGHKLIANILINKLNFKSRPRKQGNYYPVIYDNDKVLIASASHRGTTPRTIAHFIDSTGTQIQVRNNDEDNGGFIGSVSPENIFVSGGAKFVSGSWIAKASIANLIYFFGGAIYFTFNAGLTIGSSFSPTTVGSMSGGRWQLNGESDAVASAALDIVSTNKGFLKPRMTTTQRNAINLPAEGLEIYNLTTKKMNFYDGVGWREITSS